MSRILILSYSFNKTNEVGGKRWFNLAKSLSKFHEIDIITSSNVTKPNWVNDLFFVRSKYPEVLNTVPLSILQKFQYRFSLIKQLIFYYGSPYDKGRNNLKSVIKLIISLNHIKRYDFIISSGAPFSWLTIATFLKKKKLISSSTKVISDLRDPWTWSSGYGMNTISFKRRIYENQKEEFTVNFSDKIFVPSLTMLTHLEKKYNSKNIFHLPHGFDDKKINKVMKKSRSKNINLIYGGNWYNGNNETILKFAECISTLETHIEINIYTNLNLIKSLPTCNSSFVKLSFNNFIDEDILFEKIYMSNFYLLIIPTQYSNFLSTKFFEICSLKIPILYIGEKGLISEFIENYNIGFHVDLSNFSNDFLNHKFEILKDNILKKYSFDSLSKVVLMK